MAREQIHSLTGIRGFASIWVVFHHAPNLHALHDFEFGALGEFFEKGWLGVDLFFVDGEDSGTQGEPDSWALGSQALAAALVGAGYRPRLGILLDMVGDRDLRIPQEGFSLAWAPVETRWLFEVAAGLGLSAFDPVPGKMVTDDHLPFLRRGIPCVDLIDLDYPYWHTVADTPE